MVWSQHRHGIHGTPRLLEGDSLHNKRYYQHHHSTAAARATTTRAITTCDNHGHDATAAATTIRALLKRLLEVDISRAIVFLS
jgi:hypothetical protein